VASGRAAGGNFLASCRSAVNPLGLIGGVCVSGCRRPDRVAARLGRSHRRSRRRSRHSTGPARPCPAVAGRTARSLPPASPGASAALSSVFGCPVRRHRRVRGSREGRHRKEAIELRHDGFEDLIALRPNRAAEPRPASSRPTSAALRLISLVSRSRGGENVLLAPEWAAAVAFISRNSDRASGYR
jgi:hypothetical protein